jgi:hypothetical protein
VASAGRICLGLFRRQFVFFKFCLVSLCYDALVVEGLGGRKDTGRSFSEYEMMEKGAKEKEQRVFVSSTASCPNYLDFCLVI